MRDHTVFATDPDEPAFQSCSSASPITAQSGETVKAAPTYAGAALTKGRSVQRDPHPEEPVTPTAVLPVENRDNGEGVVGKRAEVRPGDDRSRGGPPHGRFHPPGGGGPSQPPCGGGPTQLGGAWPGAGPSFQPHPRGGGGGGAPRPGTAKVMDAFPPGPADLSVRGDQVVAPGNVGRVRRLSARRVEHHGDTRLGRLGGVLVRRSSGLRTRRRGVFTRLRGLRLRGLAAV